MFLLVHSKSKASISASRRRRSLNLLAPRIDEPALRAGRRVVGNHVALDAAVLEGGKIVARRPGARGELLAEQIILGGEAVEADLAVAVIFVAHDVEIVLPARHRQIGAPPVLHPLEFDEMPGIEAADFVGAAAERNVQRRLVERLLGIIGLREDRQAGDEQRHVARRAFRQSAPPRCGRPPPRRL